MLYLDDWFAVVIHANSREEFCIMVWRVKGRSFIGVRIYCVYIIYIFIGVLVV